ncbi:MAG: hydrogenase maturation nickel metallochaperone HypA [Planctomycetota bacterium]
MHETAITEALVEQVRSFRPEGSRVDTVRVEIGALEHIQPEVMATVWEVAVDGTDLAGATLEFVHTALRVECRACGRVYEPEDPAILLCPACGVVRPRVVEGSGVRLLSLAVEDTEK